jgi:hypothetical protein
VAIVGDLERLIDELYPFRWAIAVEFSVSGLARSTRVSRTLLRLLDTTAQIRVRGLPALLYRRDSGWNATLAAGLLYATSLPFIVAATQLGQGLGPIDAATGAAFVAAGLLTSGTRSGAETVDAVLNFDRLLIARE